MWARVRELDGERKFEEAAALVKSIPEDHDEQGSLSEMEELYGAFVKQYPECLEPQASLAWNARFFTALL